MRVDYKPPIVKNRRASAIVFGTRRDLGAGGNTEQTGGKALITGDSSER